MNEAAVMARQNVGSLGLEDLVALVGLPSQRRSAKRLDMQVALLESIGSFIDDLLLRAIAAQTKSEFTKTRDEVFVPYARALTSLAHLIRAVVPGPVIERVISESFCELESQFREHGIEQFGATAKDQSLFTVWSLRRTGHLIAKIASMGPARADLKEQDQELARRFSFSVTWTQFNLDCLLAAIRHNRGIQLEVLPEIIDGMRAAVNAYGYAREGLDLRDPPQEPLIEQYQWDSEDQALLDSSMQEMERHLTDLNWGNPELTPALLDSKSALMDATPESVKRVDVPFGTHLREGADIIKDWLQNPKPKE
jgi:hypothetical protein